MSTYSYEKVRVEIPKDDFLTLPEGQRICAVLYYTGGLIPGSISYDVLIERKQES